MRNSRCLTIVHALNEIDAAGNGIVNVAIDLAYEQAVAGHDVHIVSRGGSNEALLEGAGIHVHNFDHSRKPSNLLRLIVRYSLLFKNVKPDIVHGHMQTSVLVSYVLRFYFGYKLVSTVHNEYQRGVRVMGLADSVVSVSWAVARALASRKIGGRKVETVLNGVVGSIRRPVLAGNSTVSPVASPAIVALGAVSERKGSDVLLSAFERLENKDCNLYFVGNCDWDEIPARAVSGGVEKRVVFTGLVADPRPYLNNADVFVMPSRADPFPLALLEAREAGCAIVGSSVDGIPEALDHGEAGILVPTNDVISLATAIDRLLADEALRKKYSRATQSRMERYSVRRMAMEYEDIYLKLLGGVL